jgi:NarL family two-component system sensor histidine kinase YdfH
MFIRFEKQKRQTLPRLIRRIHPLCWLLLLYLISSQANNLYLLIVYGPPRGGVSEGSFITGFIVSLVAVIHIGIYDVAFRHQLRRRLQWLVLATQTVLALALIHLSQNPPATVALSLALLVAFLELLRRPLRIFLASFGYLGCLLLYVQTPAAHAIRVFFWQGENAVYELLELFILAGLLLYLQQRRSHTQTRALLDELQAAHAQVSAYALRVEELTMLIERQRLARELHDTLTQGMAGLVMQLEAANSYLGKNQPGDAQEVVQSAIARARTVLTETRYVLQDLRADYPRADDLPEMVQEEIERFTTSTGIPCATEIDALAQTPDTYCGPVWRAITEGLRNIAQHAHAHHASIRATATREELWIEIDDDGIGFDPQRAITSPGHYGLIGLRERVNLMGGTLEIKSWPGTGTHISIRLPVSAMRSCA